MEIKPVCADFALHPRRKLCQNCYHPREDHALNEEDVAPLRNVLQKIASSQLIPVPEPHSSYAWVPPYCPPGRIDEYFKKIPEIMVPKYRSEGQKIRLKMTFKQIPLTDLSKGSSRFVSDEFREDLVAHIEKLKNRAMKFGSVKAWETDMPIQCLNCLSLLKAAELVVVPSLSSAQAFHPACFSCSECKELIVDLTHCIDDKSKIFCVRHYSETLRKRCHACDELIFSSQYAQVKECSYHRDHLRCYAPDCNAHLEDVRSFEEKGEIYCESCFGKYFADNCYACGKNIPIDEKHVTYQDKLWHLDCFTCEMCGDVLEDFATHEGKHYCNECYDKHFAPRCKGCNQPFEGEDVKILKQEGDRYHYDCFKCDDCKTVIGSGYFGTNVDRIYCKDCHTKNFGVKCYQCKYPITDDKGVLYNSKPYHDACFICHVCYTPLANGPFQTVEGKWYCVPCYRKNFETTCHACEQPIRLDERGVLYSYDEYRWHADCFHCNACNRHLADASFTVQGKLLFCKECAIQMDSGLTAPIAPTALI